MITNRVTLIGKLLDDPKPRTFKTGKEEREVVGLWIEVADGERSDRFTVDVHCPKAAEAAKAMRKDVIVEIAGALRHDRWQGPDKKWTGKVYIAIDPGAGTLRSQGLAKLAVV